MKEPHLDESSSHNTQEFMLPDDLGTLISDNGKETVILPKVRGEEAIPGLLSQYERAHIDIQSISLSRPSLDDVFLKYTKTRMEEVESMRNARLARRSFRRHAR